MKPSDVGQQIHSYKQGSYKWDVVRFNHTSHEIIMKNIRDDLTYNASGRVNYCQEFIAIKDLL